MFTGIMSDIVHQINKAPIKTLSFNYTSFAEELQDKKPLCEKIHKENKPDKLRFIRLISLPLCFMRPFDLRARLIPADSLSHIPLNSFHTAGFIFQLRYGRRVSLKH